MRLLLLEISSVICALPELRGIPGIEDRFSPERLRRLVLNVASNRPEDTSSIRNDLHYQRNTEIDFLNGWIVKRGEELGMKCVLKYMIQQLVLSRMFIINHREASAIPIDFDNVILSGDKGKDD
jgi:2-dehydropantoate 2-reductase